MAVDRAAPEAFFTGNFDHLVSLSLCLFPFKKPSSLPLPVLFVVSVFLSTLCLNSSNAVFQTCWVQGCMHICPALWRLRQKNLELKTSLGSILILYLSKQSFSFWRCVLYKNECKFFFFEKKIHLHSKKCPSALQFRKLQELNIELGLQSVSIGVNVMDFEPYWSRDFFPGILHGKQQFVSKLKINHCSYMMHYFLLFKPVVSCL